MARREGRSDPKEAALAQARCLNPHPEQVRDPAFLASEFFDARDVVQVKYEMVRQVKADGAPVTAAAAAFGYPGPPTTRPPPPWSAPGWKGWCRPARAARAAQAHRPDPHLGRAAAGRQPRPAPGAAGAPDRGVLRRARAPCGVPQVCRACELPDAPGSALGHDDRPCPFACCT